MAKSVRSKSQKKNKAAKRESVFKPVENARLHRLANKDLLTIASDMTPSVAMQVEAGHGSPESTSKDARNQKRRFNKYGLSAKETRF